MKGEAQPLIRYFDGSDKRFIIPLYQRNYDWKESNCSQLFDDLLKLHGSDRTSHFFGSIVSSIESGSEDRYIIDGQQRITTVSLLLIALVNASKAGDMQCNDPKISEKIFKRYLVDEYQEEERKVKLKPIKKDMEAFDALLYKTSDKYIKGSNVTRNYEFFYDKITRCGLTVDDIFNTIKKLVVINIKLDSDDDPQLIFESLNSTGLDLSESDKIRNYLLMSLSPSEQDTYYTSYWNPIEESTDYEPTGFVRDYLTMKQGKIGRIDQIYFIFKEYAETISLSREDLMKDMHHYANLYEKITKGTFGIEKIDRKLKQFFVLDSGVVNPFFMAYFDYARTIGVGVDEQYRVLDIVESYWSRRLICGKPSNALNKVFATLHRDVLHHIKNYHDRGGETTPNYIDVMVYTLLKRSGSAKFPSDEDVNKGFVEREVYKMPVNARTFILERLENRDSNERHDVVSELASKKITIEHIMPQTLSAEWKKELGGEYQRISDQYLHTMANLTLTGYNSQYSNQSFISKRDMDKGFNDSAFRLNSYVKTCSKWTETELIERQTELLSVFLKLWPMISTTFEPIKKEAESASLDEEDFEFTGKVLQAYTFNGIRNTVTTWKEMLIQMCNRCYVEHKYTVEWICANDKCFMHTQPEGGRRVFADGLYVWADNSTNTKISILRGLLTECGVPHSELVFEFRSDADELGDDD